VCLLLYIPVLEKAARFEIGVRLSLKISRLIDMCTHTSGNTGYLVRPDNGEIAVFDYKSATIGEFVFKARGRRIKPVSGRRHLGVSRGFSGNNPTREIVLATPGQLLYHRAEFGGLESDPSRFQITSMAYHHVE
jgi:hypothetical protein